jgi:hypothetical protein
MSPQVPVSPRPLDAAVMDVAAPDWRPDAISDDQLLAVHRRLERLHDLGDAFADVHLSAQATDRLQRLLNRATTSRRTDEA